jgi:hypothetical protein
LMTMHMHMHPLDNSWVKACTMHESNRRQPPAFIIEQLHQLETSQQYSGVARR